MTYTLYQQIVLLEQFIRILDAEMDTKHSYEKAKRAGTTDHPGKAFDDWTVDDWELHHSLDSVFMHYDKKLDTLKQQMFPHRRRTCGVRHSIIRKALFPRASNYHNQ